EQDSVGEVAIVADGHDAVVAEGEVDAVHGAVAADDEGGPALAAKTLEGQLAGDDGVRADLDVCRQVAVEPAAGGGWRGESGGCARGVCARPCTRGAPLPAHWSPPSPPAVSPTGAEADGPNCRL